MTPAERAALIQAATLQALAELDNVDAGALAEVERLYRLAYARISERVAQYSSGGYFDANFTKPLLAYISDLLRDIVTTRDAQLKQTLTHAASVATTPAALLGNAAASETIASSVTAIYKFQHPVDKLYLSERLWRIDRGAQRAINSAVRQAVATGRNPLQAAREFLTKGEGIPPDILDKIKALQTDSLQAAIEQQLLTGKGNALYNIQRVFRTETTRAHAIAYIASNNGTKGLIGYKFRLSPRHKREDICDKLAAANDYGLGKGVYPASEILKIYPAHPNTTSFIVAVYD